MYKQLSSVLGAAAVSLLVCAGSLSAAAEEVSAPVEDEAYTDGFVYSDDGTVSYLQNGLPLCGYFNVTPSHNVGDIDQNTTVNAVDAAAILVAAAQAGAGGQAADLSLKTEFGYDSAETVSLFADVNSDQTIDAVDAAAILTYAAAKGAGEADHPLGYAMYFADEAGVLQQGFVTDTDGTIYYAGEDYRLLTGWQILGDGRYYFHEDGSMQTNGLASIGNGTYYFQENGAVLCSDWLETESGISYCGTTGALVHGFYEIDGATYYFDDNALMVTGSAEIGGAAYYFDTDGRMCTGFQTIGELTYYFGEDGKRCTGWQDIGESRYYFGEDGAMTTGWAFLGGKNYYFGVSGNMLTGWQTIADDQYYFYEDGTMATDTTIDGMVIGWDGVAISQALYDITVKAEDILAANGTSVANIYSYMRSTNRYKRIEATKTLAQIEELGWTHFVNYSMNNYYVVCYYMAAKMDFLLREAGHDCRVVYATHGTGDHYWNQVNVNGTWVNYDCTNGYNGYTLNQMIAAGNYTILDYLTPEYK